MEAEKTEAEEAREEAREEAEEAREEAEYVHFNPMQRSSKGSEESRRSD